MAVSTGLSARFEKQPDAVESYLVQVVARSLSEKVPATQRHGQRRVAEESEEAEAEQVGVPPLR
jgi:hypothetical protein